MKNLMIWCGIISLIAITGIICLTIRDIKIKELEIMEHSVCETNYTGFTTTTTCKYHEGGEDE